MKTHALVLMATIAFGLSACTDETVDTEGTEEYVISEDAAKASQNGENGLIPGFLAGKSRVALLKTYRSNLVNKPLRFSSFTQEMKDLVCPNGNLDIAAAINSAVLEKIVTCALDKDQSFTLTCPGKPQKVISGWAGVRSEWYDGGCGLQCQEKVSACLIASSNQIGEHRKIDMVSANNYMHLPTPQPDHDVLEGAYWGNVFAATPKVYGCFSPSTVNEYAYDSTEIGKGLPLMRRTCKGFTFGSAKACKFDFVEDTASFLNNLKNGQVQPCLDVCVAADGAYTSCTSPGLDSSKTDNVVTIRRFNGGVYER